MAARRGCTRCPPTDVVHGGDGGDLLLQRVVLAQLRLKGLQRGLGAHERVVRGLGRGGGGMCGASAAAPCRHRRSCSQREECYIVSPEGPASTGTCTCQMSTCTQKPAMGAPHDMVQSSLCFGVSVVLLKGRAPHTGGGVQSQLQFSCTASWPPAPPPGRPPAHAVQPHLVLCALH